MVSKFPPKFADSNNNLTYSYFFSRLTLCKLRKKKKKIKEGQERNANLKLSAGSQKTLSPYYKSGYPLCFQISWGDASACAPFPRDRFSKKKKREGEDLVARAQPHKEGSQTKDQKRKKYLISMTYLLKSKAATLSSLEMKWRLLIKLARRRK